MDIQAAPRPAGRWYPQVSGQTRAVQLFELTFSEAELQQLVSELRRQLAVHPNVSATVGDIQIFTIASNGQNFRVSFLHGDEFWSAVFTYEDEIRLESVDLHHRGRLSAAARQ